MDQELWKTNSKVNSNSDVLLIHQRANDIIDIESVVGNKLSDNQKTVFDKYKVKTSQSKDTDKRLDLSTYGLTNNKLLKGVYINRSTIDLDQKIDAKFQPGTNKFQAGEVSKFDPAIKILKDFPSSTVEITGNTATDGVVPGMIYGSGSKVLDQAADYNGNNSTIRETMQGRADATDKYIIGKGVDPSRTSTKTGISRSNGNAGRVVDLKIKGIK